MSAKPVEIEIFRGGTAASKGIGAADLERVVEAYDPASAPAPVVKGHPADDAPAFGVIQGLRREGNRLFAQLGNLSEELVEGVKAGRWLNRSAAFWPADHPSNPKPGGLYLKHLGFLGAAQPAIAGMAPMRFAADEGTIEVEAAPEPAVIFAAPDEATPVVIINQGAKPMADAVTFTAADMEAARAEAAAAAERAATAEAKLAAVTAEAAQAANVAFCADMVKAGKLPPAREADLVALFAALPGEAIEFSAERKVEPAALLRELLGGAKPVIQFGALGIGAGNGDTPKTAEEIGAAARKLIASQKAEGLPVMSFVAAVDAVTKEG